MTPINSTILSLQCLHPGEVPHVLKLAAMHYRDAGELERQTPDAVTVWAGLAEILENAANAASVHLRDTGLEMHREG